MEVETTSSSLTKLPASTKESYTHKWTIENWESLRFLNNIKCIYSDGFAIVKTTWRMKLRFDKNENFYISLIQEQNIEAELTNPPDKTGSFKSPDKAGSTKSPDKAGLTKSPDKTKSKKSIDKTKSRKSADKGGPMELDLGAYTGWSSISVETTYIEQNPFDGTYSTKQKCIGTYLPDTRCCEIPIENIENCLKPLTLMCKVQMNPILKWYNCNYVSKSEIDEVKKTKMLNNFYENKFVDVTVSTSVNSIKAHKVVLSAHSSVFNKVFSVKSAEEINGHTTVCEERFSYKIMLTLITFMYSGNVNNLESIAMELICAADFYNVITLKEVCEKVIIDTLNTESFCDIVKVADRANSINIQDATIQYFKYFSADIVASKQWELLDKFEPNLSAKLLNIL